MEIEHMNALFSGLTSSRQTITPPTLITTCCHCWVIDSRRGAGGQPGFVCPRGISSCPSFL